MGFWESQSGARARLSWSRYLVRCWWLCLMTHKAWPRLSFLSTHSIPISSPSGMIHKHSPEACA